MILRKFSLCVYEFLVSTSQNIAVSKVFSVRHTVYLLFCLFGDILMHTEFSRFSEDNTCFLTSLVHVALRAINMAMGKMERSSPTWRNHFRNAFFSSSVAIPPLKINNILFYASNMFADLPVRKLTIITVLFAGVADCRYMTEILLLWFKKPKSTCRYEIVNPKTSQGRSRKALVQIDDSEHFSINYLIYTCSTT